VRRLAPVLAALVLVGAANGSSGGSSAAVVETQFRSVALGGVVHATVVLPRDYVSGLKRYPVVYFLHGLPAGAAAHRE
jgi:hypothetical protein